MFVSELARSVAFYRDVFDCVVSVEDAGAALLLAPGGFQIHLREIGVTGQHATGGVGVQSLMWATDTVEGLRHFEQRLRRHNCFVDTHAIKGVSFAEGRDPDGLRVVIAHPPPGALPRATLDPRLYGW